MTKAEYDRHRKANKPAWQCRLCTGVRYRGQRLCLRHAVYMAAWKRAKRAAQKEAV